MLLLSSADFNDICCDFKSTRDGTVVTTSVLSLCCIFNENPIFVFSSFRYPRGIMTFNQQSREIFPDQYLNHYKARPDKVIKNYKRIVLPK